MCHFHCWLSILVLVISPFSFAFSKMFCKLNNVCMCVFRHISFCFWLPSLSKYNGIWDIMCVSGPCFLLLGSDQLYECSSLFIRSPVQRHSGCFQSYAFISKAASWDGGLHQAQCWLWSRLQMVCLPVWFWALEVRANIYALFWSQKESSVFCHYDVNVGFLLQMTLSGQVIFRSCFAESFICYEVMLDFVSFFFCWRKLLILHLLKWSCFCFCFFLDC